MNRGCTFLHNAVLFDMKRFSMTEDIHAENYFGRCSMANHRTATAEGKTSTPSASGTQTYIASTSAHRHFICAANWHSMERAAAGDGLWLGRKLLAAPGRVATSRCVGATASRVAHATASRLANRVVTRGRGQFFGACHARGKKTGPNPTDRRKAGSKHHLISDARGIPLAATLTSANANDITQLVPLVCAIPPVAGKRGRPRQRPDRIQGDRAYDSNPHRRILRALRITPVLAARRTAHGSGLGKTRWVIERSIAWLHQFRRLKLRYERLDFVHEAFLSIACSMICWNFLKPVVNSF
jgi:transposase